MQSCYDQDNGETLVSRVTTDCDYASKLFTMLVSFLSMIVSFAMYIVQMYATSVTLANYMLLLIPLSAVIGWGYAKLKLLIAQKLQAMLSRSTTYLIERTRELPLVKTSCTQEELVRVAKLARVYDFVSRLPDGFDTTAVSGGTNFSGGQRQCIAIARAMMVSPDYLLLDEATSNLDAKNGRCVLEALDELMHGRTTLIIAHSLSAIRKADHVIILRDGQVETSGAPGEVLEQTGNYLAHMMNRAGTAPA